MFFFNSSMDKQHYKYEKKQRLFYVEEMKRVVKTSKVGNECAILTFSYPKWLFYYSDGYLISYFRV